jgi:signal peptidase I
LPPSGGQIDGTIYSEANAGHRYLVMESRAAEVKSDYKETKIPDGSVFVLGDNRNRTQDSRDFGPVPLGNVIGMVQYVYLPAGSWGRFGTLPE